MDNAWIINWYPWIFNDVHVYPCIINWSPWIIHGLSMDWGSEGSQGSHITFPMGLFLPEPPHRVSAAEHKIDFTFTRRNGNTINWTLFKTWHLGFQKARVSSPAVPRWGLYFQEMTPKQKDDAEKYEILNCWCISWFVADLSWLSINWMPHPTPPPPHHFEARS